MFILISAYFLACRPAYTAELSRIVEELTSPTRICTLPPYPEHGSYSVVKESNTGSVGADAEVFLTYKCDLGYEIVGEREIHCNGGIWSHKPPVCSICGISKTNIDPYVIGGRLARKGELPWHVGIYSKLYTPYMQTCSGTLIRSDLVLTAAHCFWSDQEGLEPASRFAAAAGKIYRPWNNANDDDAQKSEIAYIKVPPRFRGAQTNFQDDIAAVSLSSPFEFTAFVWPACVDFDVAFDRRQLRDGNLGTVAGWGLTDVNGKPSPVLCVVDVPYLDVGRCISRVAPDFRAFITCDKICAGYTNGTAALCKGDSGGGLLFPEEWQHWKRYYLRGIVSTAPKNADLCNSHALTTFTQISSHEHFIRDCYDD